MLVLRSLIFNAAFYVNLAFWALCTTLSLPLPRRMNAIVRIAALWGRTSFWLMRVIVGTRVEITGTEHIPPGGIIVASKHQSIWETFALITVFNDPVYILKRELTWIPMFGWALLRSGMIPVNRSAGSRALQEATRRAKTEITGHGRQLMIFPEGTRRPPGAPPAYKYGVAHLYAELRVPCVPVALNAGLFWPRRSFLRRPGTIRLEIMPAIAPGMDKMAFHARLQETIETACDRLLEQGLAELAALGVEPPANLRQEPPARP
jgi:1-acyl-sn-glycerol-3-phosphate acyltransferase